MSKFHINSKGQPGKCGATQGNCPFGGEHQHYDTPAKAQAAYELSMAASTVAPTVKKEAPRPYPVEGDSVKIKPGAAAWASDLGVYEGAEGEVVAFTGTTYSVEFPDGEVRQFNHQFVEKAPEAPAPPARGFSEEEYVDYRGYFSTVPEEYHSREGLEAYKRNLGPVETDGFHTVEAHKAVIQRMSMDELAQELTRISASPNLSAEDKLARLTAVTEAQRTYYPRKYNGFEKEDLTFDEQAVRAKLASYPAWKDASEDKIQKHIEANRAQWESKARTTPAKSHEDNVPIRLLPTGTEVYAPYSKGSSYKKVGVPVDNGPTWDKETNSATGPNDIAGKYWDGVQWDYVSGDTTFKTGFVPTNKNISPRWRQANERAAELAAQRARFQAEQGK